MGKATSPTAFVREVQQRLRGARALKRLTQLDVAQHLGIDRDTYKQYESRSLIPHHHINPACELLGIDPKDLLAPARESKRRTASG